MEKPPGSSSALRRRRRIEKKTEPGSLTNESFLLDDIIIDILSRLPAKDVLRSRCVCRRWRDLSSTTDFTYLNIRRSSSMILKLWNSKLSLLDRCWEPAQTKSKIHKIYKINQRGIQFSHNGLIVAEDVIFHEGDFVIFNPIKHDIVNISAPVKPSRSEMYGVFFHPVQKEYCTLWRITLSLEPWKVQYKILNLESNPHWREIRNPCTQNARIWVICPILIDKYVYWMVEPSQHFRKKPLSINYTFNCDIMEYDIRNEGFRTIPCPVPVNLNWRDYDVNLIDIDGAVSLVQVFPRKELLKINIQTLKDRGEQLWTSSHYILSSDVYPGYGVPKAVACRNGELVLQSHGRLYVCNLKLGTSRKFATKYNTPDVQFLSHVTSLISLRSCKSNICMVEEDEENQREKSRGKEIQAL